MCSQSENKDDHVELNGEKNWPPSVPEAPAPGTPQGPNPPYVETGYGDGGDGEQHFYDREGNIVPPDQLECTAESWALYGYRCTLDKPGESEPQTPDEPQAPVIPPISEHDVATFAPQPPAVATEPEGATIVGMPLNVVAPATTHTAGGSLFGLPVTVAFAPVSYAFDFGDGTVQQTSSGGSSWDALGLPPFSATSTSHAYAERGVYDVVVTVSYSAIVDFGVWGAFPVDGLVNVSSPGASVRVVEASTALVDATCAENPAGPGC